MIDIIVYSSIIFNIILNEIVYSIPVIELNNDFVPMVRELRSDSDYSDDNNDDLSGDDEIVSMLEERYKFINDNTSTRYRITNEERVYPAIDKWYSKSVFPKSKNEHQLAWAFRTYAVRRIVGGMETSISMYPYNVAISRSGKHWCGGSIIDEQWVLTAGHCLESASDGDKKKLLQFIVRAGSSFHNRGGYQARINKVFFPNEYAAGSADFDFSLLRLDRPMPIGRNIAVLNLPAKEYLIEKDDLLIVTGWGSTHESGFDHVPDRLRFVPVPVMRLEECQSAYRFYITPRMMCAGYATGGKDACNHDSGGPAVRDGVLIGIVSFGGKKCGDPRSPGVYSRVPEITEWVEATVENNEAYDVPELKAKIDKARLREKELQKFKARVEEKKNKIKEWLRDTLKSPNFIRLAKKKLNEAGVSVRKNFRRSHPPEKLDEQTLDEVNLYHLINERILEDNEINESEILLRILAIHEVILNDSKEQKEEEESDELQEIITYLSI